MTSSIRPATASPSTSSFGDETADKIANLVAWNTDCIELILSRKQFENMACGSNS